MDKLQVSSGAAGKKKKKIKIKITKVFIAD
jgi:hypothetical protein